MSIEAKILEVQLNDSSSIGLNWNLILKNLSAAAVYSGGTNYNKTTTYETNSIPQSATIITDGLTRNFYRGYLPGSFHF